MRRAKKKKKGPGRPKGTTVPLKRHRRKLETAIWHGLRLDGHGPYTSGLWAIWVTSDEPIKPEDVEGLLTVAGTKIQFTASNIDRHVDRIVRNAKSRPVDSDPWLHMSALAIKGLIIATRAGDATTWCYMVDVLLRLSGWPAVIERLTARINELARSNVPPRENELGAKGQALLNWLRRVANDKFRRKN
jgi:hypothetical protein